MSNETDDHHNWIYQLHDVVMCTKCKYSYNEYIEYINKCIDSGKHISEKLSCKELMIKKLLE